MDNKGGLTGPEVKALQYIVNAKRRQLMMKNAVWYKTNLILYNEAGGKAEEIEFIPREVTKEYTTIYDHVLTSAGFFNLYRECSTFGMGEVSFGVNVLWTLKGPNGWKEEREEKLIYGYSAPYPLADEWILWSATDHVFVSHLLPGGEDAANGPYSLDPEPEPEEIEELQEEVDGEVDASKWEEINPPMETE